MEFSKNNRKFYNLNPCFSLSSLEKNKQQEIKSSWDFQRSLKKALSGNYTGLLFGENILDDKNKDSYFKQTLTENLAPAIQITNTNFLTKYQIIQDLNKKYSSSLFFNMIFDNAENLPLKEIQGFFSQFYFTYIITKKNKKYSPKKILPKEVFEKTEFLFPYKEHVSDSFLTPGQVYKFIKKHGPLQAFQSEIYDKRIHQDMDLEPLTRPFLENSIAKHLKNIFFSVIIPSYNNKTQLLNTLKSLALQDYPRNEYEIIVVDDGSTDNTKQAIKNFMEQYPSLNLKALSFPRVIERKQGDNRFRAGIARNLGVKHSEGQILAFLDADILTPPSYLKELKKEHEKADVILLKRYHLKERTPLKNISFDHEELKNWYYIEEKNYWGRFYQKGFNQVKTPWKYICTYGLSLSKEDFQSVGAFGKNFIFYGFEDTDLGYRLFKRNKKFLLSHIKVYHQASLNEKKNNSWSRHIQLSKTAKIFFYKHLDPDIYEELKTYMTQSRGLSYFLNALAPN